MNIIQRNVIINRGEAEVDNHILRDDIFDYHPLRGCNIYFIILNRTLFFSIIFSLMSTMVRGVMQPLIYIMHEKNIFHKNGSFLTV